MVNICLIRSNRMLSKRQNFWVCTTAWCQNIYQHWASLITDTVEQKKTKQQKKKWLRGQKALLFSTSGHFAKSMHRLRGQWEPSSCSVIPTWGEGRKKRRQLTISPLVRDYCAIKDIWGRGWGEGWFVCFCPSWALRNQTQGCVFWPRIEFYSRIISPWLLHWPASVVRFEHIIYKN